MQLVALLGMSAATAGTGGAVAAGAGAAAAAGGGGSLLGSLAAGGSLLSQISTGMSLASMAFDLFGGISKGKEEAQNATFQAKEALLASKQEELQGKQQANDILDNMLQTVAAQRVAFAGAGLDPNFGSAAALNDETRRLAEMQLGTTRDNSRMQALSRRRQASVLLGQASSAKTGSLISGVAGAADTLSELLARRETRG